MGDKTLTIFYTSMEVLEEVFKNIDITPNDVLIDMGSGDGRVCLYAAKHYGCKAVGYEIVKELHDIAVKTAKWYGGNVEFFNEDMYNADLSKFTIMYYYPYPRDPNFSFPNFKGIIICPNFELPQFKPIKIIDVNNKWKIYIYKVE